jgi:pantothenate kinase-related protein Tda10
MNVLAKCAAPDTPIWKDADDLEIAPEPFARKHPLELVIFCGSPGSGKSTYFWKNLEPLGYERVNQDSLGTVRIE